jgi:hypothetical protein
MMARGFVRRRGRYAQRRRRHEAVIRTGMIGFMEALIHGIFHGDLHFMEPVRAP